MSKKKPVAEIIGNTRNIYGVIGVARQALKRNGQADAAREMAQRVKTEAEDYTSALAIIEEYVDFE